MNKRKFDSKEDFYFWFIAACNFYDIDREVYNNGDEVVVTIAGKQQFVQLSDRSYLKEDDHE